MKPVRILVHPLSTPPLTGRGAVPPRALVLSLAALALPAVYQAAAPVHAPQYELPIWMAPLLPALILSYYRGWRGAGSALAAGMAALALAQVVALALDKQLESWALLATLVALYVGLMLGMGYTAELLHRAREEAERLSLIDELTGLPNRRFARLVLDKEFAGAERGRDLAVVVFDLDHFKLYNDTHGHGAGDAALRAFAHALEVSTRRMDLSSRYGGEEFLSVLDAGDASGVVLFAQRVRQRLATEPLPAGRLTASAGVAVYHPTMQSMDDLLAAADEALYRAKADGRDCVRVAPAPEPTAAAAAILA